MSKFTFKIAILLFCISLTSCVTFSDNSRFYQQAYYQAKKKNYELAFMKLRALLNDNPHSPYAPRAAFSIGEYYFQHNDYLDAVITFRKYINDYPNDSGVIFAELFIYKMATQLDSTKNIPFKEKYLLESIRKKMFSKPIFFIFTENKKSYSYRSMFGNLYTAFDYVDKVKVMRNDELFLELSP